MQHCLNKRIRYETLTDESQEIEEELQTWNGRPQKERKSNSNSGRRTLVKLADGSEMLYPIDYSKLYR